MTKCSYFVDEEDNTRFYGGSYRGLMSLVRHQYEDSPHTYFWVILCATIHLRTLQITGYFGENRGQKLPKELSNDERFIAAYLVDILQLLRYNTHAVLEHYVSDDKRVF